MSSTSHALGPNEPADASDCAIHPPYRGRSASWGRAVSSPLLMGYPAGLHILERAGSAPGAPTAVFVHGSLDRAESFRRVMRRLPDLAIVAYDRRGYQGSREAGVVGLRGHIADLVDIVTEVRARGATTIAVIGHSVGGDVVIGTALAEPDLCDSVGAFEPPMPWLGFRRPRPGEDRPRGLDSAGRGPGRGGRAVLQPDGEPFGLAPAVRRRSGRPPGRWAGTGGRPSRPARRPTVRGHGPRRAGTLRARWPGQ